MQRKMTATMELQELEGMARRLLAAAAKLPPGPDRIDLFKEIGSFRSQMQRIGLQARKSMIEDKRTMTTGKRRVWLRADDEGLRKMAAAGASLSQIAAQIGRSMSSVRTRALNLGVAIARNRNPVKGPQGPSAGVSGQVTT
jgi:hypothetical protein